MTTQSTANPATDLQPARTSSGEGRSATDTIEAAALEPKARLRQMMEAGKTRASEWKRGLQDEISVRPLQSLLIAAAVGAAVGLIVGRRIR